VYGDQLIVSECWFHYAQALIKRLRKLGLTHGYRNDEETQTIFRCLLSLPLLPVGDIAPGFQELKSLVTSQSPTSATIMQLLRYVERQWINKSTVSPSRLSVRDNPSRTNNSMESFHACLHFWAICSVPLLTVRPMLTISVGFFNRRTSFNKIMKTANIT